MMTLLLVKKDILITKKQTLLMLILPVIIPLFVASGAPSIGGTVAFIYTVIFTELMILQSVAVVESKYPKAAALLCSAPYSRKSFVSAKYVLFLLLFGYSYGIFSLVAMINPGVGVISLTVLLTVFLCGVIIYGVYLPLYFKYGFEKTKFFFMITIFILAFGTPMLGPYFANINIDFSAFNSIPTAALNIILFLASLLVLCASIALSFSIYSKKDL